MNAKQITILLLWRLQKSARKAVKGLSEFGDTIVGVAKKKPPRPNQRRKP